MGAVVGWMKRQQVPLYIAATAVGAIVGSITPSIAAALTISINPVLGLLLFATFLGVPLIEVSKASKDIRFVSAVLIVNFIIVPLVVWGLSRFLAGDRALLFGVLLVLLAPCVDYAIVFTGIAGGAKERLLAAAPLLMLLQIVLLPVFLFLFAGAGAVSLIDVRPLAEAFLFLIAIPLIVAASRPGAGEKPSCRSGGRECDAGVHGSSDDGDPCGRHRLSDQRRRLPHRAVAARRSYLCRVPDRDAHRRAHRQPDREARRPRQESFGVQRVDEEFPRRPPPRPVPARVTGPGPVGDRHPNTRRASLPLS